MQRSVLSIEVSRGLEVALPHAGGDHRSAAAGVERRALRAQGRHDHANVQARAAARQPKTNPSVRRDLDGRRVTHLDIGLDLQDTGHRRQRLDRLRPPRTWNRDLEADDLRGLQVALLHPRHRQAPFSVEHDLLPPFEVGLERHKEAARSILVDPQGGPSHRHIDVGALLALDENSRVTVQLAQRIDDGQREALHGEALPAGDLVADQREYAAVRLRGRRQGGGLETHSLQGNRAALAPSGLALPTLLDDGRTYPWGGTADVDDVCDYQEHQWVEHDGKRRLLDLGCKVGSHPGGVGPFGHEDLLSNVEEWTSGEEEGGKVALGGAFGTVSGVASWQEYWAGLMRMQEERHPADARLTYVGFRCARSR